MLYIVIGSLILTIFSFMYLFVMSIKRYVFLEKIKDINLKLIIASSCVLLFWLLTYSLNAVYERIQNPPVTDGIEQYSGTLGDLVGGTLNPILGLFGILVGGLAFYAQYQANKQVQEQFKIQQFESQFYEMLSLHKENVNEIEIEVLNFEYKGPDGLGGDGIFEPVKVKVKGRDVFIYFANELEIAFNIYIQFLNDAENTEFDFTLPYKAFFNGIYNPNENYEFFEILKSDKIVFENLYLVKNNDMPFVGVNVKAKYNLFHGHENMLGHYYRHLFHTVKFIVEQDFKFIPYKEKRKYLRLLRAQLSNYEQAMLFYNYLAYAREWEDGNKFLSDYRMIHNLYDNVLIDNKYFINELNLLKSKQNLALSYKDNDHIFESQK